MSPTASDERMSDPGVTAAGHSMACTRLYLAHVHTNKDVVSKTATCATAYCVINLNLFILLNLYSLLAAVMGLDR